MSELGSYLKQVRVEKNLTLEQIQEITKIRKRYLEAIENGEYAILPGSFYARAFIKSYAEALGLNANETLQKYASELPQVQSAPVDAVPISRTKRKEMRASSSPKFGKWVTMLVLYAFLAFLGFMIYMAVVNYGDQDDGFVDQNPEISGEGNLESNEDATAADDDRQAENDPSPDAGTDASAGSDGMNEQIENEAADDEVSSEDQVISRQATENGTTIFEISNAAEFELILTAADGNVWYQLTESAGGSTLDTEELPHGEERSWELTEHGEVVLRLGNTKVATLSINGESVQIRDLPQVHNLTFRFLTDGDDA